MSNFSNVVVSKLVKSDMFDKKAFVKASDISFILSLLILVFLFAIPLPVYVSAGSYPRGVSDITIVANQPDIREKKVRGSDVFNTLRTIYYWDDWIPVSVKYKYGNVVYFFDSEYFANDVLQRIDDMATKGSTYIPPFDEWAARYDRDAYGNIVRISYSFLAPAPKDTVGNMLFDVCENSKSWSFFIFDSEQFRLFSIGTRHIIFNIITVFAFFGVSFGISYFCVRLKKKANVVR